MQDIAEFISRTGKLKQIKRSGWKIREVSSPESIADHSFRTSVLALVLAKRLNLDQEKCVKMALIHDLGESKIGDFTPHDKIDKKEKHGMEREAVEELSDLAGDPEILSMWDEYERQDTPEARLVRELDMFEALIQAFEYNNSQGKNIDFIRYKKGLKTPFLRELYEKITGERLP